MSAMSELDQELQELGFDATVREANGVLHIRCTACAALVINGHATHELRCPHATRECAGCSNRVPALQFSRFCEECRS